MSAVDTNTNVTIHLPTLAAAGVTAVGRYYTLSTSKVLTQMEAQAITDAGLSIFVVYEDGNDPTKFNANLGTSQAQQALICARTVGQPEGSAIYFAVDFDCTATQFQQQIAPFFASINAVFSGQGSPYKIGVYGSGLVCQGLLAAGLCSYTWLTNSTGFRGYKQFYASKRWNLAQHLPKYFGKLQADPNESAADFGAFQIGNERSPLDLSRRLRPWWQHDRAAQGRWRRRSDQQSLDDRLKPPIAPSRAGSRHPTPLVYDGERHPQDGCAITLSVLLQEAGVNVPDTYMAIDIASGISVSRVDKNNCWTSAERRCRVHLRCGGSSRNRPCLCRLARFEPRRDGRRRQSGASASLQIRERKESIADHIFFTSAQRQRVRCRQKDWPSVRNRACVEFGKAVSAEGMHRQEGLGGHRVCKPLQVHNSGWVLARYFEDRNQLAVRARLLRSLWRASERKSTAAEFRLECAMHRSEAAQLLGSFVEDFFDFDRVREHRARRYETSPPFMTRCSISAISNNGCAMS